MGLVAKATRPSHVLQTAFRCAEKNSCKDERSGLDFLL